MLDLIFYTKTKKSIAHVCLGSQDPFMMYVRAWCVGCFRFCRANDISTDGFESILSIKPDHTIPADNQINTIALKEFVCPFPEMEILRKLSDLWISNCRSFNTPDIPYDYIVEMSALLEKIYPHGSKPVDVPYPESVKRLHEEIYALWETMKEKTLELKHEVDQAIEKEREGNFTFFNMFSDGLSTKYAAKKYIDGAIFYYTYAGQISVGDYMCDTSSCLADDERMEELRIAFLKASKSKGSYARFC